MKVTKLIREYVEEQVSKVYDTKVNPYSEQANDDRDTIQALKEKLAIQQKETIEAFISEVQLFDVDYHGNIHSFKFSTSIPGFYHAKTKAMLDEEKWFNENKRAKQAKIREIMIALELGANRQELNDMIAKLLEE